MPDNSVPEIPPPRGGYWIGQSFLKVERSLGFTPIHESAWEDSQHQVLKKYRFEVVNTSLASLTVHADPLAPLRQRDELALDEIFGECSTLEEAVDDVYQRLAKFYPEPCWEDEPFEFLESYL
ncbi:MAG: hypothetical protein AAF821_08575 [Cyanobacteria bacterium P01_D01_bin.156]